MTQGKLGTVRRYRDFLSYVIVYAPNKFPKEDYLRTEDQMTLDKAFLRLYADFPSLRQRVKDEHRLMVLQEMLRMANESFVAGDAKKGAHILQEFESVIWPSRRLEPRHFVEAEARLNGGQAGR